MLGRWRAKFGTALGRFRVEGHSGWKLTAPAVMRETGDGSLDMVARYDPPGSGWLALIPTVITFIVVFVVAQFTGFMAGPGWLLWWLIIKHLRRQEMTLDMGAAEDVIIDRQNRRMAFLVPHEGRSRWVAFSVEDFDVAVDVITSVYGDRARDGAVDSPSVIPLILVLALVIAIVGLVVTMIVTFANR